jgi:hypothetical protein
MKELVEKFQCPGCVCGMNTDCGEYNYDHREMRCVSHICGTQLGLGNVIALGMPKGFNKTGFREQSRNKIDIRLWRKGTNPEWDRLNVPVWAMEKDGFLFVRTFAPRINMSWVDVIECGTLKLCPQAIDVSKFINEID